MKNVILVHVGQSADDVLNDEGALLEREDALFLRSLNEGEASEVTIFGEHKNPAVV